MEAHQCVYFEDITELSRQKVVIIQAKPFTCSMIWTLFSWFYAYTNLKRLCRVRLHYFPHVQNELTHVFPNLTPMKHKRVRHGTVSLLRHMVGCCSGFFLALGLRIRHPQKYFKRVKPMWWILKQSMLTRHAMRHISPFTRQTDYDAFLFLVKN